MAAIKAAQWGVLAKILYKFFRPQLAEVIARSDNTLDDNVLRVLDTVVGK